MKEVFLAMNCQVNHFDGQASLLNLSSHFHTAEFGHVHIEDSDVGLELGNQAKSRISISSFCQDLQLWIGGDRLPKPLANDGMVVGNDDRDFMSHAAPS